MGQTLGLRGSLGPEAKAGRGPAADHGSAPQHLRRGSVLGELSGIGLGFDARVRSDNAALQLRPDYAAARFNHANAQMKAGRS